MNLNSVKIYWAKFEDFTQHLSLLKTKLAENELLRSKRFNNKKTLASFVISKSLTRIILSENLRLSPDKIAINYKQQDKPFLSTLYKNKIYFNVSHSEKIYVIALSRGEIGIDTEYENRNIDYKHIINRYFSKDEVNEFNFLANRNNEIKLFLKGWTRKEAVLKAVGDGIKGINRLKISFSGNSITQALYYNKIWMLYDIYNIPYSIVSLASKIINLKISVNKITDKIIF